MGNSGVGKGSCEGDLKKIKMEEVIRRLESCFIRDINGVDDCLFDEIVNEAVSLTESTLGILFEVCNTEAGISLLRVVSVTPRGSVSDLYQKPDSLKDAFYNQPSFFQQVVLSGEAVIANNSQSDSRNGEYSVGHPEVSTFLGIPFYFGGKMMGVLALINRHQGYDDSLIEFIKPLSCSCAHVLFAMHNNKHRMEAETMLKDSLSSISAIVDTVVDGIMTIDDQGIIDSFNPAAERIFGYVSSEVIGRNVNLLMPGHYRDEHDSYLSNYIATGERKVIGIGREVLGIRRDGTTFPLELSVSQMMKDKRRMFTGIVRDITERKKSESALRDNMARISAIVDTVVDGIIMIDDIGLIESFNPAAECIFGYCSDEVIGHNISMLMPEPYHEAHDSYLEHFRQTGEKRVIGIGREVEGRRKDGSTFPLELSVSEMKLGEQKKFTGIVRDVTARKKSEDELRDSAARIAAIVDTVIDGIIIINDYGIIETINPAAESIFGHESSQIVGHNVSLLMPDPFQEEHDNYLENFRRTGVRKVIGVGREVVGLRKDGSTFPLELSVSEMKLGGRRMFTGIVRDITERKNIDILKNEFISTVSHELRTPLTSIRGSLGLVTGGALGELPEKAMQMISIAENNSERLVSLINDILDIEKIAAGKMSFDLIIQPLMPIIEKAVVANEAYGTQYGVRFRVCETTDDIYVNVDENRLLQVLSNFLSNAAKFSSAGNDVEISASIDGNLVRVSVQDHGEGIPPEFHDRLFQKFSQVDSSDNRKKPGTGLGLAISKEIVERMFGQIGFSSEQGKGSVFYFCIPEYNKGRANNSLHDTIQPDVSALQRVQKSKLSARVRPLILHIENDTDLIRVVSEVCREIADLDSAETLQEARKRLSKQTYDLIVLDLGLPDGWGLELISLLKEPKPQIIALTAHNISSEMKSQLSSVLLKSQTSNEQLLKAICQALSLAA